ncbi:SDR family NAD(P)-dependent oxidoreductase [Peredibacter sp. HCB2-198]|uniref:SDR family NAD(P)-dependent oxidoreductase n=1 Tax=Peredibacter sp. HCB2-198 TaxID=3383025 RepID=UPI0038B5AF5E
MQLFIITGASKGLGSALLKQVLKEKHLVISLSRTNNFSHPSHFHISHNLANWKGLETKLHKALSKIDLKKIKAIHLINNAAAIEPIGEIQKFKYEDVGKHIQLNLMTPMLLTGWLMKTFQRKTCPITVTNISSGAALHPIVNWSLYCSTKSGLKMFTDCLNEDFKAKKHFRALSFAPGVMDTQMQETIRKQKSSNFKNVEKFKELKQKKLLLSPDTVALGLYELLQSPEKINQSFYDIREML